MQKLSRAFGWWRNQGRTMKLVSGILVLLLACCICGVPLTIIAPDTTPQPTAKDDSASAPTPDAKEPTNAPTVESLAPSTPSLTPTEMPTGPFELTLPQEVRNREGWAFTIKRIELLEAIDTYSKSYRPENGIFLAMIGTVSNFTGKYNCINGPDFVLRNGTQEYEMSSQIVRAAQDIFRLDYPGFFFGQCLDHNVSEDSYLVFDVPRDAVDLWLKLKGEEIRIGQMSTLLRATPIAVVTLKPTITPTPTRTPTPYLPAGTRVKIVGDAGVSGIPIWYMYEDDCEIDVAHHFVPSGTEAIIVGKVCYAQDYDSRHRSYYFKVEIPSLDYPTENNWVNAKYIISPSTTDDRSHVIQPGETLGIIAEKYGITVETLVALNDIEDPNKIQVGQKLIISVPANWTPPPTFTPRPKPTSTLAMAPTQPSPTAPQAVCSCAGNIYNCSHFSTQAQAQACYNYCRSLGRGDIHRLDGDNNGIACEDLP